MKILSVLLISLLFLSLVVLVTFAQKEESLAGMETSNTSPKNPPIRFNSHYFIPLVKHEETFQTPTITITPTVTPTPSSFMADLIPIDFQIIYDWQFPCGFLPSPGEISGLVVNEGKGDAGKFIIQYSYRKYSVPYVGSPKVFNGISAGESTEVTWRFERGGPITYVNVAVDIKNQVIEINEANNTYSIDITPTPYCTTITPTPQ